ncbi:MAG: aminotransferase [Alphaproteobacteria bacterium]
MSLKRLCRKALEYALAVPFVLVTFPLAWLAGKTVKPGGQNGGKPRLVWGPAPIINNKYWSGAMKAAGYDSTTFMLTYYGNINKKDDFDEYIADRLPRLPLFLKLPLLFWESLWRFDVFVLPFHGWLLGRTVLWRLEAPLLHLAGKKILIIPYGSDAYVYRDVRSISLQHGLLASYPAAARQQEAIRKKVSYWARHADCITPGVMGMDGIGRWDVLSVSPLCIDTGIWQASGRRSQADGRRETVYIAHTPNHTGFKGTEFLQDTIHQMQQEGLKVELLLIQNKQNDEVRRILQEDTDILVEQLIFTGHGISAVEGMASNLPVISNLEDPTYTTVFRRYSFLNECPLVSAGPETLAGQLYKLITRPALRAELGQAGRHYVEKYHSYPATIYNFESQLDYVYGRTQSLINLYHPLLGEYPKRAPKIVPPLIDNKIPD